MIELSAPNVKFSNQKVEYLMLDVAEMQLLEQARGAFEMTK